MNGLLRTLNVSEATSRLALFVENAGSSSGQIEGRLEGPFCIYARTVPTYYRWKRLPAGERSDDLLAFAAEIFESCLWEPEHPFLYLGDWKLSSDTESQRIRVGLRSLVIAKNRLLLNGRPYFLRGVSLPANSVIDEVKLRRLHDWRCTLLTMPKLDANCPAVLETLDQYGPFCACPLPVTTVEAVRTIDAAGPSRPAIGLWFYTGAADEATKVHMHGRGSLLAMRVADNAVGSIVLPDGIDLFWIEGQKANLLETASAFADRPWIASVADVAVDWENAARDDWSTLANQMDDAFFDRPGCVGWSIAAHNNSIICQSESSNGHA